MRVVRVLSIAVILIVLMTSHRVGAQGSGTYTDLGTLGGTRTLPIGMNDLGDVVGQSSLAGDTAFLPFVWSGGVMQPLPLLPGHTTGHARAINNVGQSVGLSSPPGFSFFTTRAVRWDNGVVTDLNTAATAAAGWVLLSAAFDINDAGQIVGYGFKAGNVQRAFLLDNGVATDLGTLGGSQAIAASLNEAGQIAGMSSINAAGDYHAFSWTNGVMTDLGGSSGSGFNLAFSINDFGEAAGSWASASGAIPLFWDAAGIPAVLPLLDPSATAYAVNNLRQIVGSGNVAGVGRAVLWEGNVAIDLETLISPTVELSAAYANNNVGQVTGQTVALRGFLIQLPVRPSALVGLITGLVADPEVQHSLLSKLNAATNGGAPLCNVLRAARNEVDAQSGKKISSEVAVRLLDAIDAAGAGCP
jgi:probable HAF family extracellular repeat protein